MRRAALLQRRPVKPRAYPKQAPGQRFPIPAPTLGMNTRDGVSSLDPREARLMENLLAETGKVIVRKGKTEHEAVSGASAIGLLWTHQGVSADVLIAGAAGELYNVTGTPSALTSNSYSLDIWSVAQFNDTSIGVNGTDTPWAYDGSSVGATGLSGSGLTIANLRTVHVVGVRLWFTEEASADVWYLAADAITGTLTKFNLSQETKGGYCVGVYEFGPYTVFVMSTGEILTYQGDPGLDFSFVKRYMAPKPVGYDPGVNVSGDLVLMTQSTPMPFEYIAAGVAFDTTALDKWGKIAPSWAKDFETYGSLAGWNGKFINGLVIFNVPLSTTESKQWVFNTRTKSWSLYTNFPASEFAELGGTIYFGSKAENKVFSNTGGTDDGDAIEAICRQGFAYPFASRVNAQFNLARLNVTATGIVTAQLQVDVDFIESGISAPEVEIATSGSGAWDGPWDEPWGEDGAARLRWSSVRGFGSAVAPVVKFHSQADVLEWSATDVIAAPAGPIG